MSIGIDFIIVYCYLFEASLSRFQDVCKDYASLYSLPSLLEVPVSMGDKAFKAAW
jgi:hypothetical protein